MDVPDSGVPVQDVVVTVNGADITSARALDNHGFPDGTPVEFSLDEALAERLSVSRTLFKTQTR